MSFRSLSYWLWFWDVSSLSVYTKDVVLPLWVVVGAYYRAWQ